MPNQGDPYVYPGTFILKNKLNIRDAALLEQAELAITYLQANQKPPDGQFDYPHLKAIHHHLFNPLYEWAGQARTVVISKGDSLFALPQRIEPCLDPIFNRLKKNHHLQGMDLDAFTKQSADTFNEINAVHPFREGNGRSLRLFFSELGERAGYRLDWEKVDRKDYMQASIHGFQYNNTLMEKVFANIAIPSDRLMNPSVASHSQSSVSNKSLDQPAPQPIDWQSPDYQDEWEKLHQINNNTVQWLVKFHELSLKKNDTQNLPSIHSQMNRLAEKIGQDKKLPDQVRTVAPQLANLFSQLGKQYTQSKGLDIS